MLRMRGRSGDAQSSDLRQPPVQNCRIPPPRFNPSRHFLQRDASNRRLHLRHSSVGPEGFVEPSESDGMLAVINRIVALAVILVAPRALPQLGIVSSEHAAFAAGRHDLVLAKGKRRCITNGADSLTLVYGALRLRTIFDRSEERRVGKECRSRWSRYQ